MQKGLKTTELRRLMGTRTTSQVIFLDSVQKGKKLGLQVGLSVEPGLASVQGPDGKVLDGYVVADSEAADLLVAEAEKTGVYCEKYGIPSVPRLATRLLKNEDVGLNMREQRIVGRVVSSFLDIATTGMARGTHYNTKEDQIKAERLAHASMFSVDRQTYGILSCLSGLTDNARKLVCWFLLEWPSNGAPTQDELAGERELVRALLSSISIPRMFQLFEMLLDSGCNNRRTRRITLSAILGSPNVEWWAVKYRRKMRNALQHAWGKRLSGVIFSLGSRFAKDGDNVVLGPKEQQILRRHVSPYLGENDLAVACECAAFVLEDPAKGVWSLPLFKAYLAARVDLAAGNRLPPEVLEGIRSTYHKGTKKEEIVRISAKSGSMTEKQKIQVQKRAESAGVKVEFDASKQDATRLYLYAFERSLDDNIRKALDEKARQSAATLPIDCTGAVVLVDASRSMFGDRTQKLRPMATALAMRDMFMAAGAKKSVIVGGKGKGRMVFPAGDTSLALSLAETIRDDSPTSVYVISDGYDNTPAGRFEETVRAIRKIGINTPIYHLNPVAAAETASVRQLAPNVIPTMPVQNPNAFGAALLKEALEQDPLAGVRALLNEGRTAMLAAISGRKALPEAKPLRRTGKTAATASKEAIIAVKDLSSPMASAVRAIYTATPNERGLVNYRGLIRESTVSALSRRGLVKVAGSDFVKHTDIGRQAASILSR